ncbi:hypothetical protein PanWU01x14_197910 [Parasponia andersonii]|uniref:Uncharacterized protein n=1 Tax=Parasponia andersonii TaxID=3476 RepID=A0A2P5BZ67_PARAD|nr:hypothetical protein PanWU01x14_197910 [Parasponia andersonii]
MLILRYEGNSEFHDVIFDASTIEIDYPSIPVHSDKSEVDLEIRVPKDVVVEDNVEIVDDLSPCPKVRDRFPLQCSQAHKSLRTTHGKTICNSAGPNECVLEIRISLFPLMTSCFYHLSLIHYCILFVVSS